MTLTITLSADIADRLRAAAEAEGTDPAEVVAGLVADAFPLEESSDALREIGEAIAEFETSRATGERGVTVEQARALLDSHFAERVRARGTQSEA